VSGGTDISGGSSRGGPGGGGNRLYVILQGPDIDQLLVYSKDIIDRSKTIPGIVDMDSNFEATNPGLRVYVNREKASDLGVSVDVDLAFAAAQHGFSGNVMVTLPPELADGMRREIKKASPDARKSYIEQALQASFPGLEVEEVRFPDLDNASQTLRLGARVRVPVTAAADGVVRFEHLFASGAAATFSVGGSLPGVLGVAERKQPLVVTAGRELLELRLSIGDHGALLESPPKLAMTAGPYHLKQSAEVTDGTLRWRRELWSENARVPVSGWPALRARLAELAANLDARVSLVLADPPS
jgi:hypothetical protein